MLPRELQDKPFTYREACDCGLTQYSLRKLLAGGHIERLEHGIYRSIGEDVTDEELFRRAVKRIGEPAVVCLLSALSHYELTDTIPKQVWLMVPLQKRTKSPYIKLYRARNPNWASGVLSEDGYSITSLERTIVDSLAHKTLISPRFGIDALKLSISEGRTTASKVFQMAAQLGMKHKILPYIEVFS